MNIQIFNRTVLAIALISLFSGFSSFAMEMPPETLPPVEFEELGMRADLGYHEYIDFTNNTGTPLFINIRGVEAPLNLPIFSRINVHDITNNWSFDNAAATSYRPEVFEFTLSTTAGGAPIGTVQFLMNNDETDLKVELNIGSYHQTYFFDVDEATDLYFSLFLMDDDSKARPNFENSTFDLVEPKLEAGVWNFIKINPENENILRKRALERQKRRIFEHERLLGRKEIGKIIKEKSPEALLPLLPRK